MKENSIEEDIKICEEKIKFLNKKYADEHGEDYYPAITVSTTFNARTLLAFENLLTRYKQLDSLIGEIDNKEVNDALHMLLHCTLKNTEYETQKQQFQIVNAYIKQLEEENNNMSEKYLVDNPGMAKYLNDNYIFKSKVIEKIEELEKQRDKVKIFKNIDEYDRCVGKIEALQELLEKD